MDTFRIDYDEIDVEAIMAQIRQRVREKKEVLYSDDELASLGGISLPSTTEPEKLDPDRDSMPRPSEPEYEEVPEREPRLESPLPEPQPLAPHSIAERVQKLELGEVQYSEFFTDALGFVDDWNIDISVDDLYRTSKGGIKGAFLKFVRSINRRLFKLTMNVDVLFPELYKQTQLNRSYVVVLHELVQEISNLSLNSHTSVKAFNHLIGVFNRLSGDFHKTRRELIEDMRTISADLREAVYTLAPRDYVDQQAEAVRARVTNDFKERSYELQSEFAEKHNHNNRRINEMRDEIARLERKIDGLRGQMEGQRQQLEYMQARQRALEQLAVLRDEEPPASGKTSEIPRGRYQAKDKKK